MMASEPWRSIPPGRPLDQMGHAGKHLVDFRALDPTLTADDVARILEYVRRHGPATPGPHGRTIHRADVEIGGRSVPVLVVVTAAGVIKTGYPEGP